MNTFSKNTQHSSLLGFYIGMTRKEIETICEKEEYYFEDNCVMAIDPYHPEEYPIVNITFSDDIVEKLEYYTLALPKEDTPIFCSYEVAPFIWNYKLGLGINWLYSNQILEKGETAISSLLELLRIADDPSLDISFDFENYITIISKKDTKKNKCKYNFS